MENPFFTIDKRLNNIESLLLDIKHSPLSKQQHPDTDRWFDINELCEYLPEKPAKSTGYAMTRERRISFHKRGKKLAFLKSEIDENIKLGKVKSRAEIEQDAEDFLVTKAGRN